MTNCVFDEREKLVKIVKGGYLLSIDSQFLNPIVRSRRTNIEGTRCREDRDIGDSACSSQERIYRAGSMTNCGRRNVKIFEES